MSPTAPSPVPIRADFRELSIDALFASPLNPRKTFAEDELQELAASIRTQGILEPLVVREVTDAAGDFEIVAGERRYRAAVIAGVTIVPCVVRTLTDAEVVEHALTENHQRRDVHPLEEAEAIQQLLDLDRAYTIAGVATKLGVSPTWVYGRLKLLRMSDAAREAYRAGALTAEHADLLARVPVHQQPAALEACFSRVLYEIPDDADETDPPYDIHDAIARARWDLLAPCLNSAASLKRWIIVHSTVDIADQAVQESLPELSVALADAAAEEQALVQVSLDETLQEGQAKALGVIRRARWIEINVGGPNEPGRVSTQRCESMRQAVITHPVTPHTLRVVTICSKRGCFVHRPAPASTTGGTGKDDGQAHAKAAQRQQELQDAANAKAKVWAEEQRPKYLAALAAQVSKVKTLTPDLVRFIVDDYTLEAVEERYGVALTAKTLVTVLLLSAAPKGEWNLSRDSRELEHFGKRFGLTPAQWEKQQKAATTKPAPGVKKPDRPTTTKPTKAKAQTKKKGGR